VIRNAGGRVSDDALRSLIISHKLSVRPRAAGEAPAARSLAPRGSAICLHPPTPCSPPRRLGTKEWFIIHHTDCGK